MQHTVYHKDTTHLLRSHPGTKTKLNHYATVFAAKAALTREVHNGAVKREDFLIAPTDEFWKEIEKKVTVKSLMSGKDVVQSVNTPRCCDPSSETYHSM
jgi:hypothetical protein